MFRKWQTPARTKFTSRIAPPNCTVTVTKREKTCAANFKALCKSTSTNGHFIRGKPYPLSKQGFYGSPIARRNLRGVPRDGHAMAAQHPARHPAEYPRNVPAMAGQWQRQCRRASAKIARKTTCLAPDLDAPCPRRKLARRLAPNLNHDIKNYEHTNHTNARS